jgi:CheY-like chemotaxis protein
MSKRKRFGELLLEMGVIAEQDLKKALDRQKLTKQPLGQIFERLGIICERDVLRILARQYHLKSVERIERPLQFDRLAKILDCRTALANKVFPLEVKGNQLHLATCNPLDLATLDGIAFRTGFQIVPMLATPTEIDGAIRCCYFGELDPRGDGPLTVLVVDDQYGYRKTITANLQQAGYRILEADNGIDALKMILCQLPHLILLEILLPGLSGKEIFRTLQTNRRTRQIPVIGLSTSSYVEEEAMLLDMGFFDFVAKPVKLQQLMARVRRAMAFCHEYKLEQPDRPAAIPIAY